MKWSIVTDSGCEYKGIDTKELCFEKVPFVIRIGDTDYVDDESLCVEDMMTAMEQSDEISRTSCPSPDSWYNKFIKADNIIAITISSGVSGSYNSAVVAKDMVMENYPEKKIFILDSLSAGSAPSLFACMAENLILGGLEFDEIVDRLQSYADGTKTIFALSSFGNLIKNGRMNRLVGALAGKLGIWGLGGASEDGKIISKGKVRGPKKVLSAIIDDMKEHGFKGGNIFITHCQNIELATSLKNLIREIWQMTHITIIQASGLCSYYAERNGLIVAY